MEHTPDIDDARDAARDTARKVGDHPALEALARAGFVVSGVLHIVLGWTAGRVGWGSGGRADQSGALSTLASNPAGTILMWVIVIGLAALVLWQLTVAIGPRLGDSGVLDRVKAVGKAVVYGAIARTAAKFAMGSGSSSSSEQSSQDVTATLMEAPAGQLLVGAVGVAVIAVGGYHVYKGVTRKFLDDLEEDPGTRATRSGTVGYPAKGAVLALVGVFFVIAAVQHQSSQASGLDGALKSLRDQPFGPYLLTVVAVGLVAFGLYCFARARHQRI
ncbi:DUF1206 domain-containing protein [Janibacter limosus]|uniref:DUF1206 domain-containing protein n=1 Tax=Janibacter limosus TaxID=53458 RepID=A0AC61U357_9MICO|nr:DUF1206 domain-containing protein [Janibacter limosus]UUZ44450.1 DUF1206 domain-containing protein [Janibacter limosus]